MYDRDDDTLMEDVRQSTIAQAKISIGQIEMVITSTFGALNEGADFVFTLADAMENGVEPRHAVAMLPFVTVGGVKVLDGVVDVGGGMLVRYTDELGDALRNIPEAELEEVLKRARQAKNQDEAYDIIIRASWLNDVPSVRNGEFQKWFNALTPEEFNQVWSNSGLRQKVESRLRSPGGFHEWLPVSRAPKFKEWGLTAEQIHALRSRTSQVRFKPSGRHGGMLSTTAHNELLRIVDDAPDYATFVTKLRTWANQRIVGGAGALPAGLRP